MDDAARLFARVAREERKMPARPKYEGTREYELVYEELRTIARDRAESVGYGFIFEIMKLKPGIYAAAQAGHLLAEICEQLHLAGRPMLSALVINQRVKMPGPGFFEVATQLGKLPSGASDEDKRAFWKKELAAVYAANWGALPPIRRWAPQTVQRRPTGDGPGAKEAITSKRYELPPFLVGKVPQGVYERWLRHKAQAHVKRDRRRGNKMAIGEAYRVAMHAAIVQSGGRDAYTGEQLDWSLISRYDNDESQAHGRHYKHGFALLPTVDHVGDGMGPADFKICGWRTNDAKHDLGVSEFLTLCQAVLEHHGYVVTKRNSED
jgi:hypothetical protein